MNKRIIFCPDCSKFDRVEVIEGKCHCKRCDITFDPPDPSAPVVLKMLDMEEIMANPPDGPWEFESGRPTFIQTDSDVAGEAHWYLTKDTNGDPARFMEVPPDPQAILQIIEHYTGKTWVDDAQILEALMPAIRALAYK